MFDAASRYLLFPLKRAVADALLPHLEMVSPAELCQWLILSDMYASSCASYWKLYLCLGLLKPLPHKNQSALKNSPGGGGGGGLVLISLGGFISHLLILDILLLCLLVLVSYSYLTKVFKEICMCGHDS